MEKEGLVRSTNAQMCEKNPRHAVSLIFSRDVALTPCRELTAIAP